MEKQKYKPKGKTKIAILTYSDEILNTIVARIKALFKTFYSFKKMSTGVNRKGIIERKFTLGIQKETIAFMPFGDYTHLLHYSIVPPKFGLNRAASKLSASDIVLSTANIDAFNFIMYGVSTLVFSELLKDGFSSFLIRHYAALEENKLPLSSPLTNALVIRYIPISKVTDEIDEETGKNVVIRTGHTYIIPRGFTGFKHLFEIDEDFFSTLICAMKKYPEKYGWSRVDLCVETTDNLSEALVRSLQFNQFSSFGKTPYVFGVTKQQFPLEGSVLQRRKRSDKAFIDEVYDIQTFYSGSKQSICNNGGSLFVAYNKKKQQGENRWDFEFRLEVRAYFKKGETPVLELEHIESIINSYKSDFTDGPQLKTKIFLFLLVQSISFLEMRSKTDYAPWWMVRVLMPLVHQCNFDNKFDTTVDKWFKSRNK